VERVQCEAALPEIRQFVPRARTSEGFGVRLLPQRFLANGAVCNLTSSTCAWLTAAQSRDGVSCTHLHTFLRFGSPWREEYSKVCN
jgi:hypothetical protein